MILKVLFANSVDPDQIAPSLIRVHTICLYAKMGEKFARIFSRQHKQTTFSDAGFLGILRGNIGSSQEFSSKKKKKKKKKIKS